MRKKRLKDLTPRLDQRSNNRREILTTQIGKYATLSWQGNYLRFLGAKLCQTHGFCGKIYHKNFHIAIKKNPVKPLKKHKRNLCRK